MLLDIATNFASGEEAVGAIFPNSDAKGLVKHALEDCSMLRHYYARLRPLGDDAKQKGAGDRDNDKDDGFPKEVLTFEVVGFGGAYHAILGRPCSAKLMAVPNYTYLKLKMPGPSGIIMIESMYEHAYDCDIECITYAEALVEAETLIAHLDQLSGEAPNSKHHAGAFEPVKAIKLVPVDPACPDDRALRISATLNIK
ncbi:uncharacterized protein [Miscanthus floridulus]|uniref:uncharacterized protein n=1 Tax=Miscanthus floridulus TaxID=154761 RepID=UPI003459D95E